MKTQQSKWYWSVVSLVFIVGILIQTHALLSINDVWLMIAAKRWLAGGTYAHDFVENNPPLILFISTIPLLIAKYADISKITAMRIFVFSISFFSFSYCQYLFKKIFFYKNNLHITILTIGLAFIYWWLPGFAFGEREHLMLFFIMPYVLSVVLRCQSQPINFLTAIVTGFLGALGFGLKPYFLLSFF